jgi:hypothetical protein
MDEDALFQIIAEKDDEIAALFERVAELESSARSLSEWQPIETAPRDGSHFIAAGPSNRLTRHSRNGWIVGAARWGKDIYREQFIFSFNCRVCPTHWMPFPEPPNSAPVRSPVRTAKVPE